MGSDEAKKLKLRTKAVSLMIKESVLRLNEKGVQVKSDDYTFSFGNILMRDNIVYETQEDLLMGLIKLEAELAAELYAQIEVDIKASWVRYLKLEEFRSAQLMTHQRLVERRILKTMEKLKAKD